jgi:hypothetical protein
MHRTGAEVQSISFSKTWCNHDISLRIASKKQLDIDILLLFLFFIPLIHQAAVKNSNNKGVDGGRGGNAA